MTKTGKLYGDSLYELALEKDVEQHTYSKELLDELRIVKSLFDENPDYIRLLQEPSIPRKTRLGLIDKAFGAQADEYLVNFLKLLCEEELLSEFSFVRPHFCICFFTAQSAYAVSPIGCGRFRPAAVLLFQLSNRP